MLKDISLKLFHNSELITLVSLIIVLYFFIISIYKTFKLRHFFITFLTITYFVLSVYNLASLELATTYYDPTNDNESIILNIKDCFNKIYLISGEGDNNANNGIYQIYYHNLHISGSNKIDGKYTPILTVDDKKFYQYSVYEINPCHYKYIKLSFPDKNSVLNEIWFVNNDEIIDVSIAQVDINTDYINATNIIDEQTKLTQDYDYQNETYFDEIYHLRNAYEIANKQKLYTAAHPLLGTRIIAFGSKLFGNNMFGFRIMGVIFSTMMLPLFYALINEFFKNKYWAKIGSTLLCFDFMHYTTARIATLEPFSVFFIIAMYYFMIRALKIDYTKNIKKHCIYLLLSGIMVALAISTKWTGVYAIIGLGIIYFIYEINYLVQAKKSNKNITKQTTLLCFWSIICFIIIPLTVYVLSFANLLIYIDQPNNLKEFITQVFSYNKYMWSYHSQLNSTHPFSSRWYEWLFNLRPIWYYVNRKTTTLQTISCFNNPVINLSGVVAIIYSLYHSFKHKDLKTISLLIMYFSQLIPWMLVSRITFAYHYYPSIPFMILLIINVLEIFESKSTNKVRFHKWINTYVVVCIIVFILFLPVISGFETSYFYVQKVLKWLPTWYFG